MPGGDATAHNGMFKTERLRGALASRFSAGSIQILSLIIIQLISHVGTQAVWAMNADRPEAQLRVTANELALSTAGKIIMLNTIPKPSPG
jgi:hypothetical protein